MWRLCLLLALTGCTTPPTQLVVYVSTDMAEGEVDGFRIRVIDEQAAVVYEEWFPLGDGPDDEKLPASFGVAPADGSADHSVRVEAEATHQGGQTFVRTAAETSYVEDKKLRLDLVLARRCKNVECAASQTCRPSGCQDVLVDEHTLPDDGSDQIEPAACVPAGQLASLDVFRTVSSIVRYQDTLYVADTKLNEFDVTVRSAPTPIQSLQLGADTSNLVLDGDTLWAIDIDGAYELRLPGGQIVRPEAPIRDTMLGVAFVEGGGNGTNRGFASFHDGEPHFVTTFDPNNPDAPLGPTLEMYAREVAVEGTLGFSIWNGTLSIVSLGNGGAPVFQGSVELSRQECGWVRVRGGFAYVSCRLQGLKIVDAHDPTSPEIVAEPDIACNDTRWRDDTLFVAAGADGLLIFDVTDPRSPVRIGAFATSTPAASVEVDGEIAYVGTVRPSADAGSEPGRVQVFDISCFTPF